MDIRYYYIKAILIKPLMLLEELFSFLLRPFWTMLDFYQTTENVIKCTSGEELDNQSGFF